MLTLSRIWPIHLTLICLALGCRPSLPEASTISRSVAAPRDEAAIIAFCGNCHPVPQPSSFVVDRWPHEVDQGISIYQQSGRNDLVVPDRDATLAWFQKQAAAAYDFSTPNQSPALDNRFKAEELPWQADQPLVAVAHVIADRNTGEPQTPAHWIVSDMGSGRVWQMQIAGGAAQGIELTQVANASHAEPTDLDGDKETDYLVTDLGGFMLREQPLGTLFWVRKDPQSGQWQRKPLKMGLVRPCDVRAHDFDTDGDLDLVVAEFGMYFVGGIRYFENQPAADHQPTFKITNLDHRAGSIHLPVLDWNGDQRTDFLALVSQQHETISAFIQQESGGFKEVPIYAAPDPAYGSSGIEPCDLDGDGQLDILYTNGDTFDDSLPKPFHAIRWLKREASGGCTEHLLATMPGVYRAVPADLDSDGDLDVAAIAVLGPDALAKYPPGTFASVVWLEQTSPGKFNYHRVASGTSGGATILPLDVDQDGDLDLLTFPFSLTQQPSQKLTLFRNQGSSAP